MGKKEECCDKIRRKGKFCKDCPLIAGLKKRKRRKLRRKLLRG